MAKANTKKVAPEPEVTGNRYFRASHWILAPGPEVDAEFLAHKANISASAARYCIEAHNGVIHALRLNGGLPPEPEPVVEAEKAKEPIPAK